jgi:hypothetical protein
VQPSIIGAWVPPSPDLTPADVVGVDGVRGDPCQTEDEAERSARAAATKRRRASPRGLLGHLHRSDLGQSPAAAQQRARQGPALRDVQATQKVSPRLGVARWHRRIPRRSRTFKRGFQTKRAWRSSGFGPRGRRKCSCPAPTSKTASLTGPSDRLASSQAMMLRPTGVL